MAEAANASRDKISFMTTSPSGLAPIAARSLGWSFALAVLLVIAGFLAIIVPLVAGLTITLMIGWLLAIVGVFHFLFAWKHHSTSNSLWELLLGLIYLIAGVYLILHPVAGLTSLTLLLASYLLFKGVLEIVQYFRLQPRHGSMWLLVDGGINLLLAIAIWSSWPFSSVWVIGTLIGVSILFTGFSRLMLTFGARRALTA